MGYHYRRWVKLHNDNRIEEELDRLILSEKDAQTLTNVWRCNTGYIYLFDNPQRGIQIHPQLINTANQDTITDTRI